MNIYRVPHFELSLRGYSVILGGVRVCVFNVLHLCEHLSSALSRCVLHSVVRTSAHEEVMELAFSDAVLVDRALFFQFCFCTGHGVFVWFVCPAFSLFIPL